MTRTRASRPALAVLLLVSLRTAGPARAETLTWEDCVREASARNPSLLAARENVRSAEYLASAALSGFFPQVTASLSATRQYVSGSSSSTAGLGGTGSTLSVSPGITSDFYSASVSAVENLFSGMQDWARRSQSEANLRAARATLETAGAGVSFTLKSAFAGLLYAQDSVSLAQEIIQRRQDYYNMVRLRFQSGNENKGNLLLYQAYLVDARLGKLQADDAVRVAQDQLASALGREGGAGLRISGTIPSTPPPASPDLPDLVRRTPDHRQAAAQEDAARAGVTLARGPFYPSLTLAASAGRQGDTFFPSTDVWSVGVTLSYPLFSGGRDYFDTKSAGAVLNAASDNLSGTDNQVRNRLTQTLTGFIEAVEGLKVAQSYLGAAVVREEIGTAQYNNGLLSFVEWDLIENDLIARQKNFLLSTRDRIVAQATWEQAQGIGALP